MDDLIVYSDGASVLPKDNFPGFGSYAYILTYQNEVLEDGIGFNGQEGWTNNIGELMGAIMGIEALLENYDLSSFGNPLKITVVSDSQYLIKGASEWIKKWNYNGWKTSNGKPVENRELWETRILPLINRKGISISFKWVKGHTTKDDIISVRQRECDKLASLVISNWKEGKNL
jgi:ribonuclease HI